MPVSTSLTTALADVPAVFKPYITDPGGALPLAQQFLNRGYQTNYGLHLASAGLEGPGRVASLSPTQQQVGQQLRAMSTPSQYAMGSQAAQAGLGSLNQATNAFGNIGQVGAPNLSQFQMGGPQQYTGSAVGQYMSPYQQQVIDVQKQEALRDFGKGLSSQNLGAARQGTYGGARNLLANTEMQRNLQTQLGGIQATGMQNAFQNAQQQFNTSQQQQQAANQANLQALLGVQQLGAGQSLEAQRANQAAQLQAAQGYGALGQAYGGLGQTLGALGTAQQASDIDRLKTMGAYGDLERAIQQQQLDATYQDVMARLNYPLTQAETISNLARGAPLVQTGTSGVQTTPAPSFASQLAGMGLTGLSLYNMFGNK
jgi:hypothetical protein